MQSFYLISGENPELAEFELKTVMETQNIDFTITEKIGRIIVVQHDKSIDNVMGYVHESGVFLFACDSEEELVNHFAEYQYKFDGTIAVRVVKIPRKIKRHGFHLEKKVGEILAKNNTINLENPKHIIRIYVTPERYVAGVLKYVKPSWRDRSPDRRPFFHPSTLSPELARVCVNLAGVWRDKMFIDPFCGTGGILLEAHLLGARITGVDISRSMLEGCLMNLNHFNAGALLIQGDSSRISSFIKEDLFECMATDPPYGRNTRTGGKTPYELIESLLYSLPDIMKKNSHICLLAPSNIPVYDMAREAGLTFITLFENRVHRSLTRIVNVMRV